MSATTGGVVLLALDCESSRSIYHHLAARHEIRRVILEPPIPKPEFLRRRLKRLGARRVLGQVLFQAGVVPVLRRASRARVEELKREHGLRDEPLPAARVTAVSSVNDPGTIELLRALRPDVVVINGTRILSRALLGSIEARFVNAHLGITPRYRGVHGGYWALVERRPELCGVTVHEVDEGIDTGAVLHQAIIQPRPDDNFVTYPYLQLAAALPLIERAVDDALAGRLRPVPPLTRDSRLRTHPTLIEYLRHRLLDGVR